MTRHRPPIKPALIYLVFACLWIICSDQLLLQLELSEQHLASAQLIKGILFILASAGLILFLLTRSYRAQDQSNAAHRTSEARLALALESAQQGLWDWDLKTGTVYFSDRYCQMLGMTREQFGTTRQAWSSRLHPDDLREVSEFVDAYLNGDQQEHYETTYRILNIDGEYRWVHARGRIWRDDLDNLRFIGTATDITARREDKNRLRQLSAIFDCSHEGVLITNSSQEIVYSNPAFMRITGYSLDEVMGRSPKMFQSGQHKLHFYQDMWQSIVKSDTWSGEIWNRRKNGEVFPIWQSIRAVRDEDNKVDYYAAVFSDISDIKHSEQELAHLAHHDPLSGLPNRLLVNERLEQAIQQASSQQHSAALILLDLDHFKLINESFDHGVGDQLIQLSSERLRARLPAPITLGRLGGDEFAVVIPKLSHEQNLNTLLQNLLDAFNDPFQVAGETVFISASFGVSLFPQDGDSAEALLRNADAALFQAKASGRKTHSFYSEEMTAHSRQRLRLDAELRAALAQDELRVFYQPIHRLSDQHLVGVEALVRWQHPERGMICPCEFIPVAEDSGLINDIDTWVLNQACLQLKRWLDQGVDIEFVAVNVSSRLFIRGELEQRVEQALAISSLPAKHLELEVTESSVMDDPLRAHQILERLRQIGVNTAIDDFGTGYSSMARLKSLPMDKLKIDQSFVAGLPNEQGDVAITQAVITLGKSLGLRVLAEGIETAEQAEFLKRSGCMLGQGYWFGRPLPADQALLQHVS